MKKVLIANRGEIACRIIASCRALGLETVAVHSEADRDALHVRSADQAVPIGPPAAGESYLVADNILAAAARTGADALHPGYGFLAENPGFAAAVAAAGLTWIGPRPKTIEDMGDKERARLLARSAGVPVLPGSPRFAPGDLAGLEAAGAEVGYPLLVKASAGGGGIGMRRVDKPEKLPKVVEATQGMAAKSFGDGTIYLEHLVADARHIEVQLFGLGDGGALHLYERECSVQRRFQKIIEESPAPDLPVDLRRKMFEAALALAHQERYRGAGTVEFVVDSDSNAFYFLEMNTRIQVEHPVTEMATGLDLVAMQLRLARGDDTTGLTQNAIAHAGHAIECRIYAENPAKMFLPSPGRLERFDLPPPAPGLRVDTGVRAGDEITIHYDPMIAKLIVHAETRDQAIAQAIASLDAMAVAGIATNIGFLKRTLAHPVFRAGDTRTDFVDRYKAELVGK